MTLFRPLRRLPVVSTQKWATLIQPSQSPEWPAVVYQSYIDSALVPQRITDNVCHYTRGFRRVFLDDRAAIDFLRQNYTANVADRYASMKRGAHRADLLRYAILYARGGVWMDIKTVLTEQLGGLLQNRRQSYTVISMNTPFERTLYQGFLATAPGCPVMRDAITTILRTPDSRLNSHYNLITAQLYAILADHCGAPYLRRGVNIVSTTKRRWQLFSEWQDFQSKETDRYGFHRIHAIDNLDEPRFIVRDAAYPWTATSGGGATPA